MEALQRLRDLDVALLALEHEVHGLEAQMGSNGGAVVTRARVEQLNAESKNLRARISAVEVGDASGTALPVGKLQQYQLVRLDILDDQIRLLAEQLNRARRSQTESIQQSVQGVVSSHRKSNLFAWNGCDSGEADKDATDLEGRAVDVAVVHVPSDIAADAPIVGEADTAEPVLDEATAGVHTAVERGTPEEFAREDNIADAPPDQEVESQARGAMHDLQEDPPSGVIERETLSAVDELLKVAQLQIESAKVCASTQLAELYESMRANIDRVQHCRSAAGLKRLLPNATKERAALEAQIQQRSGVIRVLVRVRPPASSNLGDVEEDNSVQLHRDVKTRRPSVAVAVRSCGRSQTHSFRRFDRVLGPDADQEAVFGEIKPTLPRGFGSLAGPPQAACIFAYGQTGSGKTHTMYGPAEEEGLVPRVLAEVFKCAATENAVVSVNAIEVYNDIAYDLLAEGRQGKVSNGAAERAFQSGKQAPPPGLDFRLGCDNVLEQTQSVIVSTSAEARFVLQRAEERRSTRSTSCNVSGSSRSHSLVFVQVHVPHSSVEDDSDEEVPSTHAASSSFALRLALVDLAGSERLPGNEDAQTHLESRHINLSLSALGSVIHALQHRSHHLPFRQCLMTRLLQPFFSAGGYVTLITCVGPEQRHAQETMCSLTFADRASRAIFGGGNDASGEIERRHVLDDMRDAYVLLRCSLRKLVPSLGVGVKQRLPNLAAFFILSFMSRFNGAPAVCRSWAQFCESYSRWGRQLKKLTLAEKVFQFLISSRRYAGVCRCWWQASESCRVVFGPGRTDVQQATMEIDKVWAPASASVRTRIWESLTGWEDVTAGQRDYEIYLQRVQACVVSGGNSSCLESMIGKCTSVRTVDVSDCNLVEPVCKGLSRATSELCAARLQYTRNLGPSPLTGLVQRLQVLVLVGPSESFLPLSVLLEAFTAPSQLRVLVITRCVATVDEMNKLQGVCRTLSQLKLPYSRIQCFYQLPLQKLKGLRTLDLRASPKAAWLMPEMFNDLGKLPRLSQLRLSHQTKLEERRFWLLSRQSSWLRLLHLDGCGAMIGHPIFNLLHRCSRIESLRLPKLEVERCDQNDNCAGQCSYRWCRGMRCTNLRELSVDGWESLEDAGVLALASQCPRLRTVALRHATRLTDDAVSYILALPRLAHLTITHSTLTARSLKNCASASCLNALDFSSCRQLTNCGVAALLGRAEHDPAAAGVEEVHGPPPELASVRLDCCPLIGYEAARMLASHVGIRNCSLLHCHASLPEAAQAWDGEPGRTEVLQALGTSPLSGPEDLTNAGDRSSDCAICLSEIGHSDVTWTCPVCQCELHNECARRWLLERRTCPNCRTAAQVPPAQVPAPPQYRPVPVHTTSADALFVGRAGPGPTNATRPVPASGQSLPPLLGTVAPTVAANGSRPPRPQRAPVASPFSVAGNGLPPVHRGPRPGTTSPIAGAGLPRSMNSQLPEAPRGRVPDVPRSRSLPPVLGRQRVSMGGFALVGLSIAGSR